MATAAILDRIGSVFYYTRDLDLAIEWYTKVLGLKLRFREGDWAEFETAGAALALHQSTAGTRPGGPSNATAIFEVDDLRSARANLAERGVLFLGDIRPIGENGWLGAFRDPEGNVFNLWQPRRARPGRARGEAGRPARRRRESSSR